MRLPVSTSKPRHVASILILAFSAVERASAASLLESMDEEVSALYEKSKGAIVKVHALREPMFGGLRFGPSQRVGSGFFIDEDGHLLTTATVVTEADSCWIDWRGQRVPAKIIGRDPQTNAALLKVDPATCDREHRQTPRLSIGNPSELRVGSMVIAIGYPYELPSVPTVGFVNGFDIKCGSHAFIIGHIRAGLRLSPGQGGGPVFNARGEVVGMAVAAHPLDNQCYILPIDAALKVTDDILTYGEPQHALVGLGVADREVAPTATSSQLQVYIQQVFSNTPAADAGFRDQDILVRICTNEIRSAADVLNTMFFYRWGESAVFSVLRDGRTQELSMVVGERPLQDPFLPKPPQPELVITPASRSR